MSKYVAIDIETTGTDPTRDRTVEIAMVVADTVTGELEGSSRACFVVDPVIGLQHWSAWSRDNLRELADSIYGHQVATAFGRGETKKPISERLAVSHVKMFLSTVFGDAPAHLAGKNITGFDLPFLKAMFERQGDRFPKYRHRVLDIGVLAFDPTRHDWIPDSATVLSEVLGRDTVPHRALEDALAVVEVVAAIAKRRAA